VTIETAYIPHAHVSEFLKGEWGECKLWLSGTSPRICPLNKM
jgi:hypothetical protein